LIFNKLGRVSESEEKQIMLGHKSILSRLVNYLILVVFFLVLSVSVDGQTANASAGATNTATVKEEPARPPVNQASSVDAKSERASAAVDSAAGEEKSSASKSDPPKANPAAPPPVAPCQRTINADVVAIPQPIMLNRMGAAIPDGLIFALRSDTVEVNHWLQLKPGKRPRPLVLRANVGDCLNVIFVNAVPTDNFTTTSVANSTGTTEVSLHIQGMEWTTSTMDDGSFVGVNPSSLASPGPNPQHYKLFVKHEGTFLLYTMGDTSSEGNQLQRGLFGALNVEPEGAEWYRSEVTQEDLKLATKSTSPDGHPVIDYDAKYANGTPILKMLDANNSIVHTDLTAIITGPSAGRFPGTTGAKNPEPPCNAENDPALVPANGKVDPLFCQNPAAPDRKQPYREVTIVYHEVGNVASQAFPVFSGSLSDTVAPGADGFAINYGTGGIGAEVYANRIGVGPMGNCVDCKFEEFFLSAWAVGDPAMLVDVPANASLKPPPPSTPQPPFPWIQNLTGTVTFTNGSAIVTGTGTAFKTDLSVGSFLVLAGSPTVSRGQVKTITSNVQLTLTAAATATANGAYGSSPASQPPFPTTPATPLAPPAPWLCSSTQLGDGGVTPNPNCASVRQFQTRTGTAAFSSGSATVIGTGTKFKTELEAGDVLVLQASPSTVRGTVKTITNDTQLVLQANAGASANGAYAATTPYTLAGLAKATRAYYPDDPSNVYHSYINDHIKFRILHGGTGVTHVHHQHAHQWLQSPNSDEGSYLDSQMISPGASYTLEMTYNGSGNRNKVVGDSIFHCHFYPHFAAGMWAMWRTHDVFESGSELSQGIPIAGTRALPDGEIKAGTPIPAIVPLPTIPMAPLPQAQAEIVNGQIKITGKGNPGFPFFIPGQAGARAPHPPLDFAPDTIPGQLLDGGLPRHLVTGGSISYERHNKFDWSKDLATINAIKLPEDGTAVEKAAIAFFSKRCYATFFPDGTPGSCPSSLSTPPQSTLNTPPTGFILNGLPLGPQHGAPFADPAVDDNGNPVGLKRTYKAAAIQLNVTFNKKGWHFPQERILTLWDDVRPTLAYTPGGATGRAPEPLFFRGNSGDVIEYWHTNLVPNYYLVDDFQVRTPTDIIGQHIHLVKFDVTSSDGAGNGFNYEDGTFSPQEVQEVIKGINAAGGLVVDGQPPQMLTAKAPPKEIIDCANNPSDPRCKPCPDDWTVNFRPQCQSWMGAQTTIQRWYLDPLVDNDGVDRTLRTVFTHDHFGPSTHQQAGLYAGLVVEPKGSIWQDSENGSLMGQPANLPPVRPDGGPTSWKANIVTHDKADKDVSYREFLLEFQDFQLAYATATTGSATPPITQPNPNPNKGWMDPAYAINGRPSPQLVSTGIKPPPGTQTVNYLNEPIAWRVGKFGDMSYAYDSAFKQASNLPPNGDPITPLLRAYQNDRIQIRVLVGAHMFAHQFNLEGPRWFAEPSWNNSGYRSVQAMGLSEHFEFLFNVPSSSAPNRTRTLSDGTTSTKCPDYTGDGNCVDYLYSPSLDDTGIANGMWGLFRAYDSNKMASKLQPLTSNPINPNNNVTYATCPAGAPSRKFDITAVTAEKALSLISPVPGSNPKTGQILFNSRGSTLRSKIGVMYVRSDDLDAQGRLKPGTPVEPLILRANAGDCIEVNLTNKLDPGSLVYQQDFSLASPFDGVNPVNHQPVYQSQMSKYVGLHPQLLSYDAAISDGINVGWNSDMKNQVVPFGQTITYQWYAGKMDRDGNSTPTYTPVEFGSLNLFPSDPVYQHINGLFGSVIIEPQGSTWQCGEAASLTSCDPPYASPPTSRASATVTAPAPNNTTAKFREYALMISDDFRISQKNSSAVNYRTEPKENGLKPPDQIGFRYGCGYTDFSCMLSNQLVQTQLNGNTCTTVGQVNDPQTPILTAEVGDAVRFRMTHPFGTGTSQVFTVHGHVWQRNPYQTKLIAGIPSQVIGDNSLSQWIGSRDNHGATDHFELIVDKAGGEAGQAGDYLYTVFLPNQATLGAWGIFRVGPKGPSSSPITACSPPPAKPKAPVAPKKNDLERFIREPVKDTSKP
jgi:manganese oxidase